MKENLKNNDYDEIQFFDKNVDEEEGSQRQNEQRMKERGFNGNIFQNKDGHLRNISRIKDKYKDKEEEEEEEEEDIQYCDVDEYSSSQEYFELYKRLIVEQRRSWKQKFIKYEKVMKIQEQMVEKQICISEPFAIAIISNEGMMKQLAKHLLKEKEFCASSVQLIRYLTNHCSKNYTDKHISDHFQYLLADSYLKERNFKKAVELYTQQIDICNQRVSHIWIPSIIQVFKNINDYLFISFFCLKQQLIRDKQGEPIDYYLLLHIMGKRFDLSTVLNFIEVHQIEKLIDDIILHYLDKHYLINIYLSSVRIYYQTEEEDASNFYNLKTDHQYNTAYRYNSGCLNNDNNQNYQYRESKDNLDRECSKFFYSLLQAYGNVLKQQPNPHKKYIPFLLQLKQLTDKHEDNDDKEQQNKIVLEIAHSYKAANEIDLSISYYERYLERQPDNLGIVFDLYSQYQSRENTQRMYEFFKMQLINNPQLTVYYGILISNNHISFHQLECLVREYLQKNMICYANVLKFMDFIDNTLFTQNSFFNNKDLIKSYLKYRLEIAHALYLRAVYAKTILPQLTYQPQYSLLDLFFS